jgi:hypothetical protein
VRRHAAAKSGLFLETFVMRLVRVALVGSLAAFGAGAAFAHHNSMEGFDAKAPVAVKGEIAKVDWSGEHVQVLVKAADGKTWRFTGPTVKTMRENGLDEAAFGAKETVTLRGYQSNDKACKPDCIATGRDMIFADGLKVLMDGSHAKDQAKAVHAQRVAVRAKLPQ